MKQADLAEHIRIYSAGSLCLETAFQLFFRYSSEVFALPEKLLELCNEARILNILKIEKRPGDESVSFWSPPVTTTQQDKQREDKYWILNAFSERRTEVHLNQKNFYDQKIRV